MIMVSSKLKKRFRNNTIIILLCFLISFPLFSKDGGDHSIDMLRVLGLYTKKQSLSNTSHNNLDKLQPLFSKINDYIDKPNVVDYEGVTNNFYDKLKYEFNFFTYESQYTHRELYHWGFDFDEDITAEGIPSNNQIPDVLTKTFAKKFSDAYGDVDWMESEWYRFLKYLKDEQQKRNESLTYAVKESLGLSYSTDARDIAALLYYTHLLGDHIEHEGVNSGEAVLELDKIVYNIDDHMKSLTDSISIKNSFYSDYIKKINSLQKGGDRQYAQGVLDTLSIYLPKILRFRFSKEFSSKNLRFVF